MVLSLCVAVMCPLKLGEEQECANVLRNVTGQSTIVFAKVCMWVLVLLFAQHHQHLHAHHSTAQHSTAAAPTAVLSPNGWRGPACSARRARMHHGSPIGSADPESFTLYLSGHYG